MPTSLPSPAAPSFAFIGGDPALDFVNTVDWLPGGTANERLFDYAAVLRWAVEAGVVDRAAADRLGRRARARGREAEAAHAETLRTRAILRAVFTGVAAGGPPADALRALDARLRDAQAHLGIAAADGRLRWQWDGLDTRLDGVLWPVLRSAAELLTSGEAGRVRTCAGPECGWMYVDRSRNGFRRWCQMRTCGTREKSRRRRSA